MAVQAPETYLCSSEQSTEPKSSCIGCALRHTWRHLTRLDIHAVRSHFCCFSTAATWQFAASVPLSKACSVCSGHRARELALQVASTDRYNLRVGIVAFVSCYSGHLLLFCVLKSPYISKLTDCFSCGSTLTANGAHSLSSTYVRRSPRRTDGGVKCAIQCRTRSLHSIELTFLLPH